MIKFEKSGELLEIFGLNFSWKLSEFLLKSLPFFFLRELLFLENNQFLVLDLILDFHFVIHFFHKNDLTFTTLFVLLILSILRCLLFKIYVLNSPSPLPAHCFYYCWDWINSIVSCLLIRAVHKRELNFRSKLIQIKEECSTFIRAWYPSVFLISSTFGRISLVFSPPFQWSVISKGQILWLTLTPIHSHLPCFYWLLLKFKSLPEVKNLLPSR